MAKKLLFIILAVLFVSGCATAGETPAVPTDEEKVQVIAGMTKGFAAVAAGMLSPEDATLNKNIDMRNLSYTLEFSSFRLLGSSPVSGVFALDKSSGAEDNMVMDIRDDSMSLLIKGHMDDISDDTISGITELRLNGKLLDPSFLGI